MAKAEARVLSRAEAEEATAATEAEEEEAEEAPATTEGAEEEVAAGISHFATAEAPPRGQKRKPGASDDGTLPRGSFGVGENH